MPVVENLEDLWMVSRLQRERKTKEEAEKARRLQASPRASWLGALDCRGPHALLGIRAQCLCLLASLRCPKARTKASAGLLNGGLSHPVRPAISIPEHTWLQGSSPTPGTQP